MSYKVDICADVGEDFSIFKLADYDEILKYLTSCSCACGWHAGGPDKMRDIARLAKKYDVRVGAHPGLPDLLGFGRRELRITPQEATDYIVYQYGALSAFTKAQGLEIQHISPHGAWDSLAFKDEAHSMAIVRAIRELDAELILVTTPISVTYDVARREGIRVAPIYVPEMDYDAEGYPALRHKYEATDPQKIAYKVVRMVKENKIPTVDGKEIQFSASTVTVHSDNPNVVEVLRTIRSTLKAEGVEAVAMEELC